MLGVRGVGAVARVGGVTREVRVELDPLKLQALNATAADISRQLRQIQQEASGGRTDLGGAEQSVRTIATVQSAEELARMEIVLGDGRRIRLDQVARVVDTVAERRSAALLNGEPVVGFEITRSRGAGEVEVAAGVRAALQALQAEHPDITVTEAFNFVDPVQENFDGSMCCCMKAPPGGAGGVAVPARLARHLRRGHRAAAVGHPDLRRDVPVRLHASTWSRC
jgi:multidrug efflux pump subunit AcrB